MTLEPEPSQTFCSVKCSWTSDLLFTFPLPLVGILLEMSFGVKLSFAGLRSVTPHFVFSPRPGPTEDEAVLNEMNRPVLEYRRRFCLKGREGGWEEGRKKYMHVCVLLGKWHNDPKCPLQQPLRSELGARGPPSSPHLLGPRPLLSKQAGAPAPLLFSFTNLQYLSVIITWLRFGSLPLP